MDIKVLFIIIFAIIATYYRHEYKKCLRNSTLKIQELNIKTSLLDTMYKSAQNRYAEEVEKHVLEKRELASLREVNIKCKDAVRFAMICSHPDEPRGDEKKFLQYKILYDFIKGM